VKAFLMSLHVAEDSRAGHLVGQNLLTHHFDTGDKAGLVCASRR
jgi:hypothetical protein